MRKNVVIDNTFNVKGNVLMSVEHLNDVKCVKIFVS